MQKFSTRARLLMLAVAVALISITVGMAGLIGVSQSIDALQQMFEGRAQALQAISMINELTTEASFAVSDAILDPSAQKTQAVATGTGTRVQTVDHFMQQYLASVHGSNRSTLATKFSADWTALRDKGLKPAVNLLNANNLSEAQWVQTQTIDPLSRTLKAEGVALRRMELLAAQSGYESARRTGHVVELVVIAIVVAGLLVIGLFCASMARSLFNDLGGEPHVAADIAMRVAAGDLSVQVPVRTGDTRSVLFAMRTMQQRLLAMVSEIRHSTESIAETSAIIATGNRTLSERTEEHAASIQQTSASMHQLASMVKTNAGHAAQARDLASIASDRAGSGNRAAQDAISRMRSLTEHSARVRDITSVIEGIAFQTNLLALNAAVEAARAGSQGHGFAVVAQEVRALAERSARSAKEIGGLLTQMTGEVDQSGAAVETAGKTIMDLIEAVSGVANLVDAIADASKEQTAGIDQVNAAVIVMDRVTQQNATFVREGTHAAGALENQADSLRTAVSAFQLDSADH